VGSPVNGAVEVGGPEKFRLDELVRRGLAAWSDPREVVADPDARYYWIKASERTLVPGDDARLGATRFETWLTRIIPKRWINLLKVLRENRKCLFMLRISSTSPRREARARRARISPRRRGLVVNDFCLLALSMGPFGERSTSRVAKTSSFQDKAAWRGSLTPFVVFAAEKQKSEHGD